MNNYAKQLIREAIQELAGFADRTGNLADQIALDRIVHKLKAALKKLPKEKS